MNLLSKLKPPSAEVERARLRRSMAQIERRKRQLAAENKAEREQIGAMRQKVEALEERLV